MLFKYLKYSCFFNGGNKIQLQFKKQNSAINDLKNNVMLRFKHSKVKVLRLEKRANSIFLECNSSSWRRIINSVLNDSIQVTHYSKNIFQHSNVKKKEHFFITLKIIDVNKYIEKILHKNKLLLEKLLDFCHINTSEGKINIYVPSFIKVQNIKDLIECIGTFNIRLYRQNYSYNENMTSIEGFSQAPKGELILSTKLLPNLVKRVIGDQNGYVVGNLHPKLIEKINNLSFKHKNSYVTFDIDNKLLFQNEIYYDCLQVQNIITVIKNEQKRNNIIKILNLPHYMEQFKIVSTEAIEKNEKANSYLILLVLTNIIVLLFLALQMKNKRKMFFFLLITLVSLYLNYSFYLISITMFLLNIGDMFIMFLDTMLDKEQIASYKIATLISLFMINMIMFIIFSYNQMDHIEYLRHYCYYIGAIGLKSIFID